MQLVALVINPIILSTIETFKYYCYSLALGVNR